ncbi:hypothetical protein [Streptomyces sp. WELS2]|uniref:hypothetical protein n=1 Tax=Streptomyces sp. WELS2 TaxID=2749435 RepID=UPI001C68DCB8|nr:hypothetical protein [Streptomyces sp. WELS2]
MRSLIRRRGTVAATVIAAVCAFGAAPSPAQAATNPHPIDWSVYSTHIGPDGEDVPLRVGQKDAGGIDGFGKRHIESGHDGQISSWSNMKQDIDKTLDRGKCAPSGSKSTCKLDSHTFRNPNASGMKVVFTERVDSRSKDHRPVGVITAYYYNCGC